MSTEDEAPKTTETNEDPTLESAVAGARLHGRRLAAVGKALDVEEAGEWCYDEDLIRLVRDRALEAGAFMAKVSGYVRRESDLERYIYELPFHQATYRAALIGMSAEALLKGDHETILGPLAFWGDAISVVTREASELGQSMSEWAEKMEKADAT